MTPMAPRKSVLSARPLWTARIWFEADLVVHRGGKSLSRAEITFCRFDRSVSKQELNLLQFSTGCVTQPSAGAAKVMRRQPVDSSSLGSLSYDPPNQLFADSRPPNMAHATYPAKEDAFTDGSGTEPLIQSYFHPGRNRHGPDVATLAVQVDDCPVLVPLLEVPQGQTRQLCSAEPAAQQQSQYRVVAFVADRSTARYGQKSPALFCGQPVPQANAETFSSLDAADARREVGIQQAVVGCLVGQPANRRESKIDCGGRQPPSLQLIAVRRTTVRPKARRGNHGSGCNVDATGYRAGADVQVRCSAFWMIVFALLTTGLARGQTIRGDWQGTLDTPQKLRAVLKISAGASGNLTAQFFSIDQSPDPMSVEGMTQKGPSVTFTIPSVRGSYEGRLNQDGSAITGVWTQGVAHALTFVRATTETAWALDSTPHSVRFITVEPGVKLETIDWGGVGRPVVLLAGLGNNAHVFDKFALLLTARFHVYGISRRGYGASDSPAALGDSYAADRLGDDVLAVLDALKLVHPVLVGHSIAGEELSSIGSRFPARVGGLVYLDAGYSYAFYDGSPPDFQMDLLKLRKDLERFSDAISPQEQKKVLADVVRELPQFEGDVQTRKDDLAPRPDMSATDIEKAKAQMGSRSSISGRAVFNGMQPYTEIKCPVLAIFAVPHARSEKPDPEADAKDLAVVEPQIKAFEAGIPQAKIVRITHANHYIFMSNEADVIREISTFIGSLKK